MQGKTDGLKARVYRWIREDRGETALHYYYYHYYFMLPISNIFLIREVTQFSINFSFYIIFCLGTPSSVTVLFLLPQTASSIVSMRNRSQHWSRFIIHYIFSHHLQQLFFVCPPPFFFHCFIYFSLISCSQIPIVNKGNNIFPPLTKVTLFFPHF